MIGLGIALAAAPVVLFGYAYGLYPAILRGMTAFRGARRTPGGEEQWPFVTVTIPAYNEERRLADAIENVLASDYPRERLEILVLSDASTDRTDEIARSYADRGVRLFRQAERRGKTALENASFELARGELVVNLDASIRITPRSLKALVRAFADPTVGVASGRDVSIGSAAAEGTGGESGYVGYEMWVRSLETQLGSIVGASGCFFATRRELHDRDFPESLSRDFASVLMAREHGYRSVSVDEAVCIVPRSGALRAEFRRKVRTMSRGLRTLWFKRHLMNPARHGLFAFMLASHKLARWLAYLALPGAAVGLLILSTRWWQAGALLALATAGVVAGVIGLRWPEGRRVPAPFALAGYLLASNLAGIAAWIEALRGRHQAMWEPTRRPA